MGVGGITPEIAVLSPPFPPTRRRLFIRGRLWKTEEYKKVVFLKKWESEKRKQGNSLKGIVVRVAVGIGAEEKRESYFFLPPPSSE